MVNERRNVKKGSAKGSVSSRKTRETRGTGPSSRLERKAATRERIVQAAWELFNRDGYDATTTKAVAERAGVATGTVFVHARDKPELLFSVMSSMLTDTVGEAFRSLPADAPFIEQVLHLFRGPVSYYGRHPQVGRAFLQTMPGADGPNAKKLNAETFVFIERLGGLVRAAGERGELARELDANLAARAIFAFYFVSLLAWLNGVAPIEAVLDPLLRQSLELLVRGLHA